jgi:hypothetical protein
MQASSNDQSDPDELVAFESRLRRSLYRFDCPDSFALGEYAIDLLPPERRLAIAGHAATCGDCRDELATLRAFLAMPLEVPDTLGQKVRRLVATLFNPTDVLAYGGLRGAAEVETQIFQVEDVLVSVGPDVASGTLVGLVTVGLEPPESLGGREVRLSGADGSRHTTTLDPLANFSFEHLHSGTYSLEIDLPQSVIQIESLRLD